MSTPTTQPVYDRDYFIAKFEAIPAKKWGTGRYYNPETQRCCAMGHCGKRDSHETKESIALTKLFRGSTVAVLNINDGGNGLYQQPTPRARILAALRDLPN